MICTEYYATEIFILHTSANFEKWKPKTFSQTNVLFYLFFIIIIIFFFVNHLVLNVSKVFQREGNNNNSCLNISATGLLQLNEKNTLTSYILVAITIQRK